MKTLRTLSFALLLLSSGFTYATLVPTKGIFADIPAKTVIIKHPDAADINAYFSKATTVNFEIYKAGSKEQLTMIINSIKSNKTIESCTEGMLNGDYQTINITLKSTQDKTWFVNLFKTAGLRTIRINNNPIVEVDKL